MYRLAAHRFDYELTRITDLPISGVTVHHLTFPSPVETAYPENNTVHAEYYVPNGKGPFPAVIVLEISGGGEGMARSMASVLAQNKVAGLFVRMAYYGPQPETARVKLMSPNFLRTAEAIRQTVLDCRRATAWLESRPEIDPKKLGIVGTSLGSFLAALTGEMEPKLSKIALLLGGGGFVDGYYDHPQAKPLVEKFEKMGGSKQLVKTIIAPLDPITLAANLKGRGVMIIAAKRDDMVPPQMAKALWTASGEPKIVWLDTTHLGAAFFAVQTLREVVNHFKWE